MCKYIDLIFVLDVSVHVFDKINVKKKDYGTRNAYAKHATLLVAFTF